MKKELVPHHLNLDHLAKSTAEMDGSAFVADFPRIQAEISGDGSDLALDWRITAELEQDAASPKNSKTWLNLGVDTTLRMVCQRCLTDVLIPIQIDRDFRFVESEELALAQDDESEEDLLVNSTDFDLSALIEDEVLMEAPIVPVHEVCPVEVQLSAGEESVADDGKKPNPFAVLEKLKTNKAS